MRSTMLMLMAATLLVGTAAGAFDLGITRPAKPAAKNPASRPSDVRQGGDTIADAVVVTVPFYGSGSTLGYNDDHDEACPYTQSTSPDVVYTLVPPMDHQVDIDLLGSTYDTKVYVYDEDLALVACNDDFYPDYVSKLEMVPLEAGVQYFIVVDGYGGDAGDYVIRLDECTCCVIECPAGAELEGEPPLEDGYVDTYNSGCGSAVDPLAFGVITQPLFCGVSGWYLTNEGLNARDSDWFEIVVPDAGTVEITGDAEFATYLFELAPTDCGSVAVAQNIVVGPCVEGTLMIAGTPGSVIWFWVGPTTFEGPQYEYDYVLYTNLTGVATEARDWSAVKGLFD